jgi:prephenate dehydratase
MKVAFQGARGAYSEIATTQYFAKRVETVPVPNFADVFTAVVKKKVEFGVIPMENSLTGSIHQNFDLLLKYKLWIGGEIKLRISHSLLAPHGASLKTIRKVYSHPQALWQCQRFLKSFSRIEAIPYFDTAGSARYVAALGEPDSAAIASRFAATHYDLKILKAGIEDNKENYTRFLVLSRPPQRSKGEGDKTSVAFALRDIPGALHRCIEVFAKAGIQIFKVESRPIPGRPWEYLFYVDFGEDLYKPVSQQALKDLKKVSKRLRVLGTYKKA